MARIVVWRQCCEAKHPSQAPPNRPLPLNLKPQPIGVYLPIPAPAWHRPPQGFNREVATMDS